MKKIFFLMIVTSILSSCVSLEQVTVTNVIDYSRFSKNGIFVTESNSVNFEYMPLGSVVSVSRGAVEQTLLSYKVDMDKAFSDIGKRLKDLDANGLINLKIASSSDKYFYYITVTGMAIRRENINNNKIVTYKEALGKIDNVRLEIIEAYSNGTLVVTSEKLNVGQLKKAWKQFFYKQSQIKFYTPNGYSQKTAYAGFIDNQIVNYETNEFISLE